MSFARGDLARRAALADNLAVPEPWSSNDDPRVFAAIRDLKDEFRRLGITDEDGKGRLPDFLLDYENLPPIKPTTLDRAHARNSAATRWDQNGNLVEDSSDTLRLQRDPATQAVEGLLYEPQRTQELLSPTDIASADWEKNGTTATSNTGSAKGQNFDSLTENSQNRTHYAREQVTRLAEGSPFAISTIVKPNGRQFFSLSARITDDDNSARENPRGYFDLSSGGAASTENLSSVSVVEHDILSLGGGWYRCVLVINPNSAWGADRFRIELSDGDLSNSYQGDGSSGIYVLHAQAEVSREVTTPILSGNATRGADKVNYGFSFPDRTTGVAYSIEQQAGNDFTGSGGFVFNSLMTFGLISDLDDDKHGVLHYGEGLNDSGVSGSDPGDGFRTITRNSDDDSLDADSVLDQTIDRFEVRQPNNANGLGASFTVRQIAIHTQPHTQAQKDTLRDQYLTQP